MLSQDVRLFVRLSLTRRYCVEMGKHIIIFFIICSHTTFPWRTFWHYSDGDPRKGEVKCIAEGIKNRDFQPISRFLSEIIQERAIVTMECE